MSEMFKNKHGVRTRYSSQMCLRLESHDDEALERLVVAFRLSRQEILRMLIRKAYSAWQGTTQRNGAGEPRAQDG